MDKINWTRESFVATVNANEKRWIGHYAKERISCAYWYPETDLTALGIPDVQSASCIVGCGMSEDAAKQWYKEEYCAMYVGQNSSEPSTVHSAYIIDDPVFLEELLQLQQAHDEALTYNNSGSHLIPQAKFNKLSKAMGLTLRLTNE